ncbi:MAG: restriction endonuclease subunit S [Campylobacterales bacterium]|nr:restriction endonuclease subunit S [Campylobacterales bacterium]
MEDLFESSNGDFDLQKKHMNGKGEYVITSGLTNYGILGKTDINARIFDEKTITIDMFGSVFYRQFKYKMVTHARVFSIKPKFEITENQGLFLSNAFHFINKKFSYENMCSWLKIKEEKIQLPVKNGEIDFDFMENFITELKAECIAELEAECIAELEAYLTATGLKDYTLTIEEQQALENFEHVNWQTFNLESLFGKSTRGKRLKSADRISGTLPFVTAGETDEGISAFIGNDVTVFSENTTTIDMFGSAKYRNYRYGADDHIAVVHTENLPKFAAIFATTAIHKSSYTGKFNYGRNFYAKDADELNILLPSQNGQPDYKTMETLISALQKLVIKDIVLSVEQTKKIYDNIE